MFPEHLISFYKDKNILVAGGSGTIGTPLVKRLMDMGAYVTVASIDSVERVMAVFKGYDVYNLYVDLTDFQACKDLVHDYDYVFNLVCVKGSTQIGESKVASTFVPLLMADTNLMEASRLANVKRFLFVGSICEYPNLSVRHEDSVWDGPPHANDRFAGIAKRVGEAQAEAYMLQYGWDAGRIVRLSNVYGPYDDFDPETAQVIPALISRAVNGENPMKIAGDGTAERDFIFVDDVVDGILMACKDAPPCTPINLGSGRGISIKELVETLVDLMPEEIEVKWDSSKPSGDRIRILDTNRAKALLSFVPRVNLEEGIKKTMEWYKNNKFIASRKVGKCVSG